MNKQQISNNIQKETEIKANFQAEQDKIQNFYFIIFYSNPQKDIVRCFFDDGSVKMTFVKSRFLDLVKPIVDSDLYIRICNACLDYGVYYILDRDNQKLRELSNINDEDPLLIKDIFSDARKDINGTVVSTKNIDEQYNRILNLKQKFYSPSHTNIGYSRRDYNKWGHKG